MAPVDGPVALDVEVVYGVGPHQVDRVSLRLAPGSTVGDAVAASGLRDRHPELAGPDPLDTGVWCRAAAADTALRDRDRVEVYRPLTVDPKEARRLRYKRRGQTGKGQTDSAG